MDTQQGDTELWVGGPGAPAGDLKVPQDICDWVNAADLVGWVQEEVKAMSALEPQGSRIAAVLADPALAVLAFAYVRGVFDHEEIAKLCHSDPTLRLMAGGLVSPAELLSFRGKHRDLIVKVLVQLLVKATRQKFNLKGAALAPALRRRLQFNANDRLDNARHIDRGDDV